jgi:type IV pilus assembly protein PilM
MISKTITTLNIEASSIRLLSVMGKQIQRWESIPLPPGLVRDTLIADPIAVASAIDDLFGSTGASKKDVVVSLTGLRSVFRIVALPKLRAAQMKEAVRWAARREIPMPLEEMYLSWQVIGHQNGEERAFLLGTPRSLVEAILQTLWKAGIKPRAMDLKPFALARMVNQPEAIIIDLESDSTSFLILVRGIPQVMHTMISPQEGLLLNDKVQKLTEDLSRTIRFYDNAQPEQPISSATPVFLTGEMASDSVIAELVRKGIIYSVESPALEVECSPELPVPQYAVNIGLALREMPHGKWNKASLDHSHPISVNVLPAEYRRRWWWGIGRKSQSRSLVNTARNNSENENRQQ